MAEMRSTTGTAIESYLEWVREELKKKMYGEVGIEFTICRGQVTMVQKKSIDTDQIPLKKQNEAHFYPKGEYKEPQNS